MVQKRLVTPIACAAVFLSLAASVQAYERCENYEYAELKDLPPKILQAEYCRVQRNTNDIYKVIGSASPAAKQQVMRDRDQCWAAARKIERLPRFQSINADCPEVTRVTPIEAFIQQKEAEIRALELQMQRIREQEEQRKREKEQVTR